VEVLRKRSNWATTLRTLLHVAAGWLYFGKEAQARTLIDEARHLLYEGKLPPQEQKRLACTYVATLGQASVDFALRGIEELFQKLEQVHDTFTVNTHYALSKLAVVEAVVLAVVTEDFAMGSLARRWLDDDEFLVRRRIHQDLHAAMSRAGH
jgi:hypothetical protein